MKSNYFTIDKEKIEKRNMERDYTIPYHELLDPDRENDRRKMVEFFKDNEVLIYHCMGASDIDYEVFVGCMEIYNNTGVNYFYDFSDLRLNFQYKTLDKGIKGYSRAWDSNRDIFDRNFLNNYLEEVSSTIKLMQFFGIENLYDTSVNQYMEYYNRAETELNEWRIEELEKRKVKDDASFDKMRNSYYNFEAFDNNKFNRIFKECIQDMDMGKNIYILDEVININVNLEDNKTFIVFLRKNDKVCFVGRTTNLLNYIGTKSKEHGADRVAFYPVDNDYIDDIYIKALIEFDVAVGGTVKNTNRKYISMTSVKRIFKELYKINLVHIKKIIAKYDIERFLIGDIIIFDKIELDKATRDYLNLE